ARTRDGRQFRLRLTLVDADEASDRILQLLAAGAAFPAACEMRSHPFLVARRQLPLHVQKQLLVGQMFVVLHQVHRSAERAMRAKDRAREMDTAPSDILRISAISR